jgi:lipoate-protein ligase A
LLHAREVTYSVALPWHPDWPWHAAYSAINDILVAVLRDVGIEAMLAPATPPQRDLALCFAAPAEGELIAGGRKLVASAVWRQADAYLQHGSLLVHDDQARLLDAARVPTDAPQPAATLATLSPALDTADRARAVLAEALPHALARIARCGPSVVTCVAFAPTRAFDEAVTRARVRISDPAWLWRR